MGGSPLSDSLSYLPLVLRRASRYCLGNQDRELHEVVIGHSEIGFAVAAILKAQNKRISIDSAANVSSCHIKPAIFEVVVVSIKQAAWFVAHSFSAASGLRKTLSLGRVRSPQRQQTNARSGIHTSNWFAELISEAKAKYGKEKS